MNKPGTSLTRVVKSNNPDEAISTTLEGKVVSPRSSMALQKPHMSAGHNRSVLLRNVKKEHFGNLAGLPSP
jgi:hypothetical protein